MRQRVDETRATSPQRGTPIRSQFAYAHIAHAQENVVLLEGKSLVVTGGNSGIGEFGVLAAAAEGANVVIDYVAHPEETTALIA